MILLATWGGLRFGELAGLTRADFDLAGSYVHVSRQVQELADGRLLTGPPKTDAGRRTIGIPPHVILTSNPTGTMGWRRCCGVGFVKPRRQRTTTKQFQSSGMEPACPGPV